MKNRWRTFILDILSSMFTGSLRKVYIAQVTWSVNEGKFLALLMMPGKLIRLLISLRVSWRHWFLVSSFIPSCVSLSFQYLQTISCAGISLELRPLFYREKLMTPNLAANVEAPDGLVVPGSPTVDVLLNETAVAPQTPVIHSKSIGARVSEVHNFANSNRGAPASSFESSQQRPSSIEDLEFDILMNEVSSLGILHDYSWNN